MLFDHFNLVSPLKRYPEKIKQGEKTFYLEKFNRGGGGEWNPEKLNREKWNPEKRMEFNEKFKHKNLILEK